MANRKKAPLCHHFVYAGGMPRHPAQSWHLSGVHLPPDRASPEVVGVFIAQQEAGWQVTGELGRQDGRLIVRSFSVQPVPLASKAALETIAASRNGAPGSTMITVLRDDVDNAETPRGGVTAELLRSIPFGALLTEVLVRMALWQRSWPGLSDDGAEPDDWEIGRRAKRQAREIQSLEHKVGRRPNGDEFYREVAKECLDIQRGGASKDVLQALGDRRGVPKETARGWIKVARKRGMLAPGSPGRRGFEAGVNIQQNQRSGDGT